MSTAHRPTMYSTPERLNGLVITNTWVLPLSDQSESTNTIASLYHATQIGIGRKPYGGGA